MYIIIKSSIKKHKEISDFCFGISRYNPNVMDNPYSKNAKVNSPIYDINGIDINNRIYVTERDIFPTLRNEELGRTYFILEITYQELYNLAIETVNKYIFI